MEGTGEGAGSSFAGAGVGSVPVERSPRVLVGTADSPRLVEISTNPPCSIILWRADEDRDATLCMPLASLELLFRDPGGGRAGDGFEALLPEPEGPSLVVGLLFTDLVLLGVSKSWGRPFPFMFIPGIAFVPTPRGSSTQKVEPTLALDFTPSLPPLSLTICRTRASPRPVPFPPC